MRLNIMLHIIDVHKVRAQTVYAHTRILYITYILAVNHDIDFARGKSLRLQSAERKIHI